MRSTNTHPGSPFAAVTAAGFVALARGNAPREGEEALRIVWDWDERTSRGARRRAVMHLVGLALGPGDFAPGRIEADFDEDGHPVGAYYANDWELTSASELLRAVGDLDSGERVLIALWDRGHGFVAVIEGGEEYVDIGSREALEGVSWSPATSEAEPRWISGRRDRRGVSLVMLDTHPPKDPGNNADTAGLRGLCDALDDLLYECPFDVQIGRASCRE